MNIIEIKAAAYDELCSLMASDGVSSLEDYRKKNADLESHNQRLTAALEKQIMFAEDRLKKKDFTTSEIGLALRIREMELALKQ